MYSWFVVHLQMIIALLFHTSVLPNKQKLRTGGGLLLNRHFFQTCPFWRWWDTVGTFSRRTGIQRQAINFMKAYISICLHEAKWWVFLKVALRTTVSHHLSISLKTKIQRVTSNMWHSWNIPFGSCHIAGSYLTWAPELIRFVFQKLQIIPSLKTFMFFIYVKTAQSSNVVRW